MLAVSTLRSSSVFLLALLLNGWVSLDAATLPDRFLNQGLRYRLVGPFRGGRVNTVSGVPAEGAVRVADHKHLFRRYQGRGVGTSLRRSREAGMQAWTSCNGHATQVNKVIAKDSGRAPEC